MFRTLFFISHHLVVTTIGIAGLLFLVTIHEFGHFLMCKLFRVRTPSFSIGFGPKLISHKFGDTEFSIAAIPLGGYVEIAGNAEVGQGEQKDAYARDEYSFATKPFYQKFLIMIGGILFNVIFAFAIGIAIFATKPTASFLYPFNAIPTIGFVQPDSPAQKIGLEPGDRLISLNGQEIGTNVPALIKEIQKRPGETITLTIDRAGTQKTVSVTLEKKEVMGRTVGLLGAEFAVPSLPIIEAVEPDSPAQKIGLKPGDRMVTLHCQSPETKEPITITVGDSPFSIMKELQNRPGENISLTINRAGSMQTLDVTLDKREVMGKTIGILGVTFAAARPSFFECCKQGIRLITFYIVETFSALKHMFSKRDVSGMAGPVGIISETAKGISKGFSVFLLFLAIISINLAILNLLPLPVFDGGQILFFGIEAIIGRSLPEKVRVGIHLATWALLLVFAVYMTFRDIARIISGWVTGSK